MSLNNKIKELTNNAHLLKKSVKDPFIVELTKEIVNLYHSSNSKERISALKKSMPIVRKHVMKEVDKKIYKNKVIKNSKWMEWMIDGNNTRKD
jgi:hypothetical protein